MKNLIIVASPPACGKTYFSKALARRLNNPVYLDKDTIIPLSKKVFEAGNEEYNRDSEFFKKYVRDAEYEAIMDIAFESLTFNDNVIVNAPFSKEFRSNEYIGKLESRLEEFDGRLIPIWITCDIDLCHKRMTERNSERDIWKLKNWDKYIQSEKFSTPDLEGVFVVDTSTDEVMELGMNKIIQDL